MAELRKFQRVLPCLWDSLIDREPRKSVESAAERSLSVQRYREGVARDIEWLLNTPATMDPEEAEDYPTVGKSILNFGVRSRVGSRTAELMHHEIEYEIRQAILRYEPRVLKESLVVQAVEGTGESRINLRAFQISCQIWAFPLPEDLLLYTELDLETGNFEIERK